MRLHYYRLYLRLHRLFASLQTRRGDDGRVKTDSHGCLEATKQRNMRERYHPGPPAYTSEHTTTKASAASSKKSLAFSKFEPSKLPCASQTSQLSTAYAPTPWCWDSAHLVIFEPLGHIRTASKARQRRIKLRQLHTRSRKAGRLGEATRVAFVCARTYGHPQQPSLRRSVRARGPAHTPPCRRPAPALSPPATRLPLPRQRAASWRQGSPPAARHS